MLTYKLDRTGKVQAAYSGRARVGYIDSTADDRFVWTLNTIQPEGGRATGIARTDEDAKLALEAAWVRWVDAAGLEFAS